MTMASQHEADRAHAPHSMGASIPMNTFDSRIENRLRYIEQYMLLKRRVSDAEPEGTDGQVIWTDRLRQ